MAELAHDQDIFGDEDMVSTYSRAQAIKDGVLRDVTSTAREAGFTMPVTMTTAAWSMCVHWGDAEKARHRAGQAERGRLWDVLQMLRHAIRTKDTPPGEPLYFELRCIRSDSGRLERVILVAQCGPGDTHEPVITILLPGED